MSFKQVSVSLLQCSGNYSELKRAFYMFLLVGIKIRDAGTAF